MKNVTLAPDHLGPGLRRDERDQGNLEAAVGEVLDRRLRRDSGRPLAVALSGGGDSLALTLLAADWAKAAGRRLLVLTVDHGLRPESGGWTAACAATAARLGAAFQALAWTGDKPQTGLPAAARAARHRLIADAARRAGARVILLGHTADDVVEARRMREAGSTTPEPREWGPSPAWPEGRSVFLLRPLLGISRAGLRRWLAGRREAWIDDPANDDLRYARARARRASGEAPSPPAVADAAALARAAEPGWDGGLMLERAALRAADPAAAGRFLAAACLSAAGTNRPPPAKRTARLIERLVGHAAVVATLAGARIEADALTVRFLREAGEAARGGLAPLRLEACETGVWDGRFEVAARRPAEIRRLAGLAQRLPRDQLAGLKALPPAARLSLPALMDGDRACCPLLGQAAGMRIAPLAYERLLAACGAVQAEPA